VYDGRLLTTRTIAAQAGSCGTHLFAVFEISSNGETMQLRSTQKHTVCHSQQGRIESDPGEHGEMKETTLNGLKIVRFIRLPEVRHITGLGKTTLYGMMKGGEFPPSVKIGGQAVGWVEEEVAQWAANRIAQARLKSKQQSARLAA
jgi:prophage regulatory protein